ncbi:MAG: hypothetical protein EP343_16315 [Deltaproteobacteria bacterium]|nr:MAG: hypothetical protein EP343_16315 [Deltaproteobacteria bacterium]
MRYQTLWALIWLGVGGLLGTSTPSFAATPSAANQPASTETSTQTPGAAAKKDPAKKQRAAKKAKKKTKLRPVWNRDLGLGGYTGSWGNMPYLGLRGAIPLSPYLAMRLSLSLFFATQREPIISYTSLSLGLLVRLPTLFSFMRHYAVTRLDFWPLWNIMNINPEITKISERPTLGISILVGMEIFLVNSLSFVLEAGFSSGMIIGFAPIKTQFEAFGFVMQSGLQMYF